MRHTVMNSPPNKTHRPRWLDKFAVVYVVAGFFFENYVSDEIDNFFAACAGADDVAEIVFDGREQAGTDLAVCGQAYAGTGSAEHLSYWGDYADLAFCSVGKAIFPSCFAAA